MRQPINNKRRHILHLKDDTRLKSLYRVPNTSRNLNAVGTLCRAVKIPPTPQHNPRMRTPQIRLIDDIKPVRNPKNEK